MQKATTQSFGKDPINVRETDHYQQEYVKSFVEKWDELIDWDRRWKSEGDFFIANRKEFTFFIFDHPKTKFQDMF